ncbi:hypothetical protein F2Q68_00043414 [Brassica cretica]|uniref:Uncharacterized protein n=1 Tax=Brassica cretica TaxID=69181 RepID=A0A8S9LGK5_BRACR|nr:hypothetical protein F2Q68_00043414 [Brassica cretica]
MMLPSNGSLEVIESSANSVVSLMKVVGGRLRSGAIVMATDGHNGILSHQEGCFSPIQRLAIVLPPCNCSDSGKQGH